MIKAVIFDLDGTLANTLPSIAHYANAALRRFGYDAIPLNAYNRLVGDGAKTLVERMLGYLGDDSGKNIEKVYNYYNKTYDDNPLYLTEPYEGISDLLDELRRRGIQTAVLSNKPHSTAKKVVGALFGDKINLCFGKLDEYPKKPDVTLLKLMLTKLGAAEDETLYVGDTSTDMLTGRNAEIFTVGVLWGFRDLAELTEYRADLIIAHPSEIIRAIDKIIID